MYCTQRASRLASIGHVKGLERGPRPKRSGNYSLQVEWGPLGGGLFCSEAESKHPPGHLFPTLIELAEGKLHPSLRFEAFRVSVLGYQLGGMGKEVGGM